MLNDYMNLIEMIPAPSIIVDSRGFIVYANSQVQSMAGYQVADLVGKTLDSLQFNAKPPKTINSNSVQTSWYLLDGSTIDLHWTMHNLQLEGICYVLYKASNPEQLVESMGCGFCMIDIDSKIVYLNKILADIFGYSCEEMLGRPISAFSSNIDVKDWNKFWHNVNAGLFKRLFKTTNKTGDDLYLHLTCKKIVWQGKLALQCLVQDCTFDYKEELEAQRKQKTINVLSDINITLATNAYNEHLLSEQLGKIGTHFSLDRIMLIHFDKSQNDYSVKCRWSSDKPNQGNMIKDVHHQMLCSLIEKLDGKNHFIIQSDSKDSQPSWSPLSPKVKTILLQPVKPNEAVWGYLAFISIQKSKEWKEWEIELCNSFGASLSLILDNLDRQKLLQISEQKLEESFQITPDALIIVNKGNLTIENCNLGFKQLIGKTDKITFHDLHNFFNRIKIADDFNTISNALHSNTTIKDRTIHIACDDGTDMVCMFSCESIKIDSTIYTVINIRNVSELLKTQKLAKETSENLSTVFDLAPDPMIIFKDKYILKANKMFIELIGYTQSLYETIKFSTNDMLDNETIEMIKSLVDSDERVNIPAIINGMNGRKINCLLSIDKFFHMGQECFICILHDITEIKLLQDRLRESLERYETLAESVQQGIMILRGEYVIYFNKACQDLIGYEKEELLTKSFLEYTHKDDLEKVKANFLKRLAGEDIEPLDVLRVVTKSGQTRYLKYSVNRDKIDNENVFIASFSDVTDLVHSKEKALQSSAMIETIVSTVHDVLYIKDLEGRFLYFRWPKEEQAGANFDHYIGKTLKELTPNLKDLDYIEENRLKVIETGKPVKFFRSLYSFGKTEPTEYETQVTPLLDNTGKMVGTIGIAHNVTEEMAAKRKLGELENRMSRITETIPDIIFQLEGQRMIYISPAVKTYGFSQEELFGKNLESIFSFSSIKEQDFSNLSSFETELISKKGMVHNFEIRLTVEGSTVIGVARDISERKNYEQAKKVFLKSVAHELRNPLTLILGYSELLMNTTQDNKELHNMASTIFDAAESEKKRLNEFFDLDKTVIDYNFEIVNVWQLLNNVYTKLWMLIPKMARQKHGTDKTSFGFFVPPDLKDKKISVDKNKFSEIIENLVSNSVKYSPADRIALYMSAKAEENRIIINFSDKGIGIDEKDIPLIFRPFYQINAPGYGQDGLGLGLANLKMHVQAHNGNISVSSKLGEGTTFTLSFPFVQ